MSAPAAPTSILDSSTEDLTAAAQKGTLRLARHRDELIARVRAALDGGKSVLLVGPQGVGKSAIVNAVAAKPGKQFNTVRRMTTAAFLTETKWLGEIETRTAAIVKQAIASKSVLHFTDVLNLRGVGTSSTSGRSVFDQLRPDLIKGALQLIAEVSPEERSQLAAHRALNDVFQAIEVPPLPDDVLMTLVGDEATRLKLELPRDALEEVMTLPPRFLGSGALPGTAFELLEQLAREKQKAEESGTLGAIDRAFVGRVFSTFTGLPRFVVMGSETLPAREVRRFFAERVVGQPDAIEAVTEVITLYKAGLNDPDRAIGTFLFVGPTGVGKTELARCLAEFLFGSPTRMLRFDLSEFSDWDGFKRLIGDPKSPEQPARLIDPVRAQPFQVVLFDELEKAHQNVWDLLLPLLDEGRLTTASGDTVNFRRTIIIATSNAGAIDSHRSLGFGAKTESSGERSRQVRGALEKTFRPEFLNRFQHIVSFRSLSKDELRLVARKEMSRVLSREGIARQRLVVDVSDAAIDLALERGYDPKYGARALKREVQRTLVLPLAQTLVEQQVLPGSVVRLDVKKGALEIDVSATAEARSAARAEITPVRDARGDKVTIGSALERLQLSSTRLAKLEERLCLEELQKRLTTIAQQKAKPGFWKDASAAAQTLGEQERIQQVLSRLEKLSAHALSLAARLKKSPQKATVATIAAELAQLEESVSAAERELTADGSAISDAVISLRPIGQTGKALRERLAAHYAAWARSRGCTVDWLNEPNDAGGVTLLGVRGPYAYLYLRAETGLHRLGGEEEDKAPSVVEVTIAPWMDAVAEVRLIQQRSPKFKSAQGTAVRAEATYETRGENGALSFSLSGPKTVAELNEVAPSVAAAVLKAPEAGADIVRRYDVGGGFRDALTGMKVGKTDALAPERLHALLAQRIARD